MSSVVRQIAAPRHDVYASLLDAAAVERWRVPDDMTSRVHEFDPREGGSFRVSLSYTDATRAGKTSRNTDTYRGRFVELVPDRRVVEAIEFETGDVSMRGEMRITTTLTDAPAGGTNVEMSFEGLPPGVRPEDNDEGTRMALARLAALLEAATRPPARTRPRSAPAESPGRRAARRSARPRSRGPSRACALRAA